MKPKKIQKPLEKKPLSVVYPSNPKFFGDTMKVKAIFILLSFLFAINSNSATAQETVDYKKLCQEARKALKTSQKNLKTREKEKAPLIKERTQTEKEFLSVQKTIAQDQGCSEGNASNTPGCQKNLQQVRQLGKKMNELDAQMAQVNKKYRKIQRDRLLSEKKLKAYRCQ